MARAPDTRESSCRLPEFKEKGLRRGGRSLLFEMIILFDKAERLHLRDSSPVLWAPGEGPAIGQGFSDLLPTMLCHPVLCVPTALCTYVSYNTIPYGNFCFLTDSFPHLLLLFGRKYNLQDDIQFHTRASLVKSEAQGLGIRSWAEVGMVEPEKYSGGRTDRVLWQFIWEGNGGRGKNDDSFLHLLVSTANSRPGVLLKGFHFSPLPLSGFPDLLTSFYIQVLRGKKSKCVHYF